MGKVPHCGIPDRFGPCQNMAFYEWRGTLLVCKRHQIMLVRRYGKSPRRKKATLRLYSI